MAQAPRCRPGVSRSWLTLILMMLFFPLLYSNIPEFSKYIQKLPSLEKIQKQQAAQQQKSVTAATEEKTKPTVGTSTRSTQDDNNV